MEVFSSAEITYSSGPGVRRRTRRRTGPGPGRPSGGTRGSRMKIQDRYCQGLSASASSQRRTVEAETDATMPRAAASRASSGHDQRDSGAPVSAGSWQARALTSATWTGVKRAGARSVCGRPARPGRRPANRSRQQPDRVHVHPHLGRYLVVRPAPGGEHDDRRALPVPVRCLLAGGHLLEPVTLGCGQGHRCCAGDGHQGTVVPGPLRPGSGKTLIPAPDTKDDPWPPFPSRPRTAWSAGWPSTPGPAGPRSPSCAPATAGRSPGSTPNCPTARSSP